MLYSLGAFLLLLLSWCGAVNVVWPDNYRVNGIFKLPYANISEEIEMIHHKNVGARIDLYGGLSTTISNLVLKQDYEIAIAKDHKICSAVSNGGPSATRYHLVEHVQVAAEVLPSAFPDLTNYVQKNTLTCPGSQAQCVLYQLSENIMGKVGVYNFFMTSKGAPYMFQWVGYDDMFGSHFDEYVFMYRGYTPNYNDTSLLQPPPICQTTTTPVPAVEEQLTYDRPQHHEKVQSKVTKLLRPKAVADFDSFLHWKHNNAELNGDKKVSYAHETEYETRLTYYHDNSAYIRNRNDDKSVGFTLKMNHFGDMHHKEMRGIRGVRRTKEQLAAFRAKFPPQEIVNPKYTISPSDPKCQTENGNGRDYRNCGAVTAVKDQAVCGSCWSFGSTGALEGAWYFATGNLTQLSEQYLVDCAWGTNVSNIGVSMGCDGGFSEGAYTFIQQNGGIPNEKDYGPYLGINDYCHLRADYDMSANVKGYTTSPSGDENGLVNNLKLHGPHEVSIDASHRDFSFYYQGIYYDSQCKSDVNDLDHSVLAVGYGSDSDGDYWLVKNSWSTHWGDKGFVKMARNKQNNCGVATDAVFPIVQT